MSITADRPQTARAHRDSIWFVRLVRIPLPLALLGALGILILRPLVHLYWLALDDGASGLKRFLDTPHIWNTMWTTLYLAIGSTVIAMVIGVGLAWCNANMTPRLQRGLSILPVLPLVVPAVAFTVGWTFLFAPRAGYVNQILRRTPFFDHLREGPFNIYSTTWIILITGFNLAAFVYVFVRAALKDMSNEYEAAGLVAGGSRWLVFKSVTLPLLRPAIVYSTSIVFLLGLGQFTAPLLLGSRPGVKVITTEIFYLRQRYPIDYSLGAAYGVPLLTAGASLVVAQRLLLRNAARYATGGGRLERPINMSRRWPAIPVIAYALLAVVGPLLAIIHVSLSRFWSGDLTLNGLTLDNFREVLFENDRSAHAIGNSVRFSLIAVVILVPLSFLIAIVMLPIMRVPSSLRTALEAIATAPLAVPAALMGFALLGAYTREPFVLYGTSAAIVVTYVTIMVPYAFRSQHSSMVTQGSTFFEAGRVCGASSLRVLLTITFPMARRGVAAGVAIMVVMLSHEFAASLMVRSARTEVMGTVLYDLWGTGTYPEVAVLALAMVGVTAIGVAFGLAFGGRRAVSDAA